MFFLISPEFCKFMFFFSRIYTLVPPDPPHQGVPYCLKFFKPFCPKNMSFQSIKYWFPVFSEFSYTIQSFPRDCQKYKGFSKFIKEKCSGCDFQLILPNRNHRFESWCSDASLDTNISKLDLHHFLMSYDIKRLHKFRGGNLR